MTVIFTKGRVDEPKSGNVGNGNVAEQYPTDDLYALVSDFRRTWQRIHPRFGLMESFTLSGWLCGE